MKAEKGSKCHKTEHLLLATANSTTDGLFLYGNKEYSSQLDKMTQACTPSIHSTPQWNLANKESPEELLPLPDNLTCKTSISQYWFHKISSCLKSQDAKVADDQYDDVAKCRVNQPFIPGHSWVPITHTDEHQPAWKSTGMINKDRRRHFHLLKNQAFIPFFLPLKKILIEPFVYKCILIYNLGCSQMCKLTISTTPQIMKSVECAWDKSVSLKTMTRTQYFNTSTY